MKTTLLSLFAALALPCVVSAQNMGGNAGTGNTGMRNEGSTTARERGDATTMIGGMDRAEFDRRNQEGSAKVAAITPTSTPLSAADQKLMKMVAMGGMMQLQVSQAAVDKVMRDDVKVLAQSEVEEQTGVSAKLQEIARAKGMTLPTTPDPETGKMMTKMQGMSGAGLDRYYTQASGVKGHMKLSKTMSKVQSSASDPALKALAAATMPVIQMHMQVSQKMLNGMGKGETATR